MELVGISGKAESGKDFIATQFLRPVGFQPWALAWHFKIWIVGQGLATYDEVFSTKPPHVRKLLQEHGTEKGRMVYGEDIWCDTAAAWIKLLGEAWGSDRIVVTDIRFPNEVAFIHRLGGKVIRLHAPSRPSKLTLAQREHISETALDDFDGFDLLLDNEPGTPPASTSEQLATAFRTWGWTNTSQRMAAHV